jgi:hypothetical protein
MAKTITLRLTGEAEKLVEELGLNVSDAISKALWLLKYAKNNRLALLKPGSESKEVPEVDLILTLQSLAEANISRERN